MGGMMRMDKWELEGKRRGGEERRRTVPQMAIHKMQRNRILEVIATRVIPLNRDCMIIRGGTEAPNIRGNAGGLNANKWCTVCRQSDMNRDACECEYSHFEFQKKALDL